MRGTSFPLCTFIGSSILRYVRVIWTLLRRLYRFRSQPPPVRHRSMRVFMNDDRHAMAKHSVIYPTQEELEGVQNMVSHTERALKAVSDWLDKQEKGTSKSDSDGNDADKERRVHGTASLFTQPSTCFIIAFLIPFAVSTRTRPRALCGV